MFTGLVLQFWMAWVCKSHLFGRWHVDHCVVDGAVLSWGFVVDVDGVLERWGWLWFAVAWLRVAVIWAPNGQLTLLFWQNLLLRLRSAPQILENLILHLLRPRRLLTRRSADRGWAHGSLHHLCFLCLLLRGNLLWRRILCLFFFKLFKFLF